MPPQSKNKRRVEEETDEGRSQTPSGDDPAVSTSMAKAMDTLSNFVNKTLETCMKIKDTNERLKAFAELGNNPLVAIYGAIIAPKLPQITGSEQVNNQITYAKALSTPGLAIAAAPLQQEAMQVDMNETETVVSQSKATYYVQLKSLTNENRDALMVYRKGIESIASQMDGFSVINNDIRVRVPSLEYATKAVAALKSASFEGKMISELYEISTVTKSFYSIKSKAISKAELTSLPWVTPDEDEAKNYSIDFDLAINKLLKYNDLYFKSPTDIENIEIKNADDKSEKFMIQIYVSTASYIRFLTRSTRGKNVDMEKFLLLFFEEVYLDVCFRCLNEGHGSRSGCKAPAVCKYCGANHESKACDQRGQPCCFRCKGRRDSTGNQIPTNHNALASTCPFIRRIKQDTLERQKRQLINPHHV